MKSKYYRILLTIGTFILSLQKWVVAFPDSLEYIRMVNNIAGLDYPRIINNPFHYRVLVPFLAAPLAIFTGAEAALGIISIISSLIWANIFYSICAEFSESNLITFVVTCAAVISPALVLYGGTALVDAPAMAKVWFSTRCSFGMPVVHQTDPAVWAHEFTENTLASIIREMTGKCGLKWKLRRYTRTNDICLMNKPTIAHFLTSLTEISGNQNEDGFIWLSADEYYECFLVGASSKIPPRKIPKCVIQEFGQLWEEPCQKHVWKPR